MMIDISHIGRLSDRDLLAQVHGAAARERDATVELIALLMEVDARRLYLAEGCASLFTYCRQLLHLSEHAAYHRIEAARAARRFPVILERLADGSVNLYKIQFTVDRETHDKLRRAQDLLRHTIPDGDLAAIFDKAITLLLEHLSRAKHGAAGRPRSTPSTGRNGGGLTAHTCCDAARGVAIAMAGSAPLSAAGAGCHGAGLPRVPSSRPVCRWRRSHDRESRITVPRAQRVRG